MRPLSTMGPSHRQSLCQGTGLSQTPQAPSCPGAFAHTVPSACTILVPVCSSTCQLPASGLSISTNSQARHLPLWGTPPPPLNKYPSSCTSPSNSNHLWFYSIYLSPPLAWEPGGRAPHWSSGFPSSSSGSDSNMC